MVSLIILNRTMQGIALTYLSTILCSRSNDQLHTVLYCTASLSWLCLCVDVIDGHRPHGTRSRMHT